MLHCIAVWVIKSWRITVRYLMVYAANAATNGLLEVAKHSVRLATASLAIGKDARVVAGKTIVHNWLAHNCTYASKLLEQQYTGAANGHGVV